MRTNVMAATLFLGAFALETGLTRGSASLPPQPPALSLATHINSSGQTCSGSMVLMLMHDTPCRIAISAAGAGQEVLQNSGGRGLATSYKLCGPALDAADVTWVNSAAFITHTYNVRGTGPQDPITLWVQAAAPVNAAADPGVYSAGIVLTVSW